MFTEFSGLIATYSAIKQAAGVIVDARDAQVLAAAKLELMERLAEANMQLLQVIGLATKQASDLQAAIERVRQLEAHQSERARYQLVEAAHGRGVFAYRLRASGELTERQDEPVHFLCQPCFDAGIKVILRLSPNRCVLLCPTEARHHLRIAEDPPLDAMPR